MNYKKNLDIIFDIIVFIIAFLIFYRIYYTSDIFIHADFAKEFIKNGKLPGNFLYYWIISILAFKQEVFLIYSSIFTLAILILLKYIITKHLITELTKSTDKITINVISLCIIFISSIFIPQLLFKRLYLGAFIPNIWHNSTTIAVLPFSILLFWITIKQINNFTWNRLFIITILIALNALIKPSYLFVYAGALPFTHLISKGISKDSIFQFIPLIITILSIYLQKINIYNAAGIYSESSIEISFFKVYQSWHPLKLTNVIIIFILSFITSFAFPLYVLIKNGIKKNDTSYIFAWISQIGALIIFVIFTETGHRWWHGNFIWQVYICSFILFVVSIGKSYKEVISKSLKPNLYQIILGFHIICGLIYILQIIIFKLYI